MMELSEVDCTIIFHIKSFLLSYIQLFFRWIWLEVDTSHPEILRNLFDKFRLADVKRDFLDKNRFVKLVKIS